MTAPTIIQLSKLNVTQRIIEALANVTSRAVLFSVKETPKDATQIADELDLSLSAVYKSLSALEDLTLAEVARYVISPEGKKIKHYRSRIGRVEITLEGMEPVLSLHPNTCMGPAPPSGPE